MLSRLRDLRPSPTLEFDAQVKLLIADGMPVVNFAIGEPQEPPHPFLIQNLQQASNNIISARYTLVQGILALRQEISSWIDREYQVQYEAQDIIVTAGCKMALLLAIMAGLENDQDQVFFGQPYWTSYPDLVKISGGSAVPIITSESERFLLSADRLEPLLSDRTSLVILNSPHNPSGQSYTMQELEDLANLFRRHPSVKIITDDLYHPLGWNKKIPTLLQVAPDLKSQICLVHGLSKSHRVTGWRIGFAAASRDWVRKMSLIQSQMMTCAAAPIQLAAVCAYQDLPIWKADLSETSFKYCDRHHRLKSMLEKIPGIVPYSGDAGFYLFANIQGYLKIHQIASDWDFCQKFLEQVHIACLPGSIFGAPEHVRFSLTVSDDELEEAIKRILKFHHEIEG